MDLADAKVRGSIVNCGLHSGMHTMASQPKERNHCSKYKTRTNQQYSLARYIVF